MEPQGMTRWLEIRGLTKRFEGVVANEAIDFDLVEGEIRCVIGPNGAGKTTFISMISGHHRPTAGRILFEGHDITAWPVARRARAGIARKFQTPSVFPNLTAYENIELSVLTGRVKVASPQRRTDEVLEIVRLTDVRGTPALALSHGQRQWLEIGLLLGMGARLLLLDEPTAGMTAAETHATGELVRHLVRDRNLSAIIIEHDINFIRDLKAPVTVLHLGRTFAEGDFSAIAADERVRGIYLGSG
jgi:ABC-type uncharacterized transport system ATPase subunit